MGENWKFSDEAFVLGDASLCSLDDGYWSGAMRRSSYAEDSVFIIDLCVGIEYTTMLIAISWSVFK